MFMIISLIIVSNSYAIQSTIVDVEGSSCSGEDKSRKQTEQMALDDAKRNAIEYVVTYIKSETKVKDFEIKSDIVKSYSQASVKVIEIKEKAWNKTELGDCYQMKIKAEVIPSVTTSKKFIKKASSGMDSNLPLSVQIWAKKKEFKYNEKIKIYIKGNKSFYGRILYTDTKGETIQILPNPYRTDNYFTGGIIYEIPNINDKFELKISDPYGEDQIIIYSSTSPLGDIKMKKVGGVYLVTEKEVDIKTRDVNNSETSEFSEERITIKTSDK